MIGSSIAVNNKRSHDLMSRAAGGGRLCLGASCAAGVTQFYGFDDTEPHRIGDRPSPPCRPSWYPGWQFSARASPHRSGTISWCWSAGAVLAPGKRTVTQALRVMGLADKPGFGRYHEVLNRARWDARDVARRLLLHLLAVLSPSGEVVIGIDDTIERRWGGKSRHAASIATRFGRRTATSSRPADCAGCRWR